MTKSPFIMPIAEEIWGMKYQLKNADGTPIDKSVYDTQCRIADALAQAEKPAERQSWAVKFESILYGFKFLPAGRITAGAGSNRNVTLSNCFTMDTIQDDLGDIYRNLREAALTMKEGGGIGYDFSTLRPTGSLVKGVAADSSGPLPFMDNWDSMCRTIMSAGERRGAMMATMICTHPDIYKFIEAKRDPARLRKFNMSILVTDAFMEAVKTDDSWDLQFNGEIYKTVSARDLWNTMMQATYDYAEPGVIFIDRVNRDHNIGYLETIATTNPCFTGDTKVWTSEGPVSFKELAESGDTVSVLTQDDEGSIVFRDMRNPRMTQESAPIFTVTFDNDTSIDCTGNHEFFLPNGSKCRADNLQEGQSVAAVYDPLEPLGYVAPTCQYVSYVTKTDREEPVYCGTVDDTARFFVALGNSDGVLVSNCGEKPMGPYASCLLSSVNLSQFVEDPFGSNAHLDVASLVEIVSIGVRMMDNVVDVGRFPLEAQLVKAKADRQLGLGITGMADMLAMVGIRYGSDEAAEYSETVMKQIHLAAYKTSISLAREKGAFPNFDADGFLRDGTAASRLPTEMQNDIANGGIRNALLTSIAPTGTISLYANNVSSGIEPSFAHEYTRNVTQKDGTYAGQRVTSYAKAIWEQLNGRGTPMPNYCVTTADLTPSEHIKMQAAVQKWVDSSISKTVNVPEDIPFGDFTNVYMEAYDLGCKGCTTYRPNDITGSILTTDEPTKEGKETPISSSVEPMERPDSLEGSTYKLKWPGDEHATYVTINDYHDGTRVVPFEIFINSKNMGYHQWVSALTRMISAVFRRGGDVSFVVEELKAVFDPNGGMFFKQKFVPSIIAAIGGVIEDHMKRTGYDTGSETALPIPEEVEVTSVPQTSGKYCPKCHSTNYIMTSGCDTCFDCGHSKCS